MTFASAFKSVMTSDAGAGGANTLLTGGIYTFDETGRLGVNRDSTPSAFDGASGLLKPCCVVKDRAQIPDGGVNDDGTQATSYAQIVELWFYNDGDAGYTVIEQAVDRVYTLFHGKKVSFAQVHWAGNVNDQRDRDLDYAALSRSDFEVRAIQS